MKSCLFILLAMFILAGIFTSIGTIYFLSSDTKAEDKQEALVEQPADE